jgi:hypothetical protein
MLSATYAAYRCFLRDPNATSLGEYSERRDVAIQALKAELDDLLAASTGAATGGVAIVAAMEPI